MEKTWTLWCLLRVKKLVCFDLHRDFRWRNSNIIARHRFSKFNYIYTKIKIHTSMGSTSWAMMTSWAFLFSTSEVMVFTPKERTTLFRHHRPNILLALHGLGQCSGLKSSKSITEGFRWRNSSHHCITAMKLLSTTNKYISGKRTLHDGNNITRVKMIFFLKPSLTLIQYRAYI